jgi:hypothetical protein
MSFTREANIGVVSSDQIAVRVTDLAGDTSTAIITALTIKCMKVVLTKAKIITMGMAVGWKCIHLNPNDSVSMRKLIDSNIKRPKRAGLMSRLRITNQEEVVVKSMSLQWTLAAVRDLKVVSMSSRSILVIRGMTIKTITRGEPAAVGEVTAVITTTKCLNKNLAAIRIASRIIAR